MSDRIRVTLPQGARLTDYLLSFATNKERAFELLRLAQQAFTENSGWSVTKVNAQPALQNEYDVEPKLDHDTTPTSAVQVAPQPASGGPVSQAEETPSQGISLGSSLDAFFDS